MKRPARLLRWIGLLTLGMASLQCAKDSLSLPSELGPAKIDVIDGDGQTAVVGDPLADSLVVRVTNSNQDPVQGSQVVFRFMATNSGADLIPDTALTGADGRARTKWVLGHTAGDQVVRAEVKTDAGQTLAQSFHATAIAGAAATVTAVKGDQQTGQVGTALADSLVVKVTDQFGNPVSGYSVGWSVTGGGSVSAASVVSGVDGRAAVQRVLGTTAGTQGAEAVAPGLAGSPVPFTHHATVGTIATKLGMGTQPAPSAQSGSVLAQQPKVQLQDAGGNPVPDPGVMVHVTVSSGGTLGGTDSAATDATGLASFSGLSITGAAGNYTLNFTAPSLTGVTSAPVAISAGLATQLTITTQPSSAAQSGVPFARQPVIQLRDDALNPVHQSGVPVTAGILFGPGGVLSQQTVTVQTDANGVATFTGLTISGALGSYTMQFSGPSQPAVVADPIVLSAGPAKVLVLVTPPSASAQSGIAFPQQPVIRIEDGTGNPVSQSATVTASIASGGGTLGGTKSVNTSASGVATFTDLAISGTVGTRVLDFSATGLTKASANVDLTAGAAATLAIHAGDNQTATVGSPVAVDPAVLVTDAAGNPVAGVAVTFAVAPGSGSIGGANAVTDASGIAEVGGWTLGTTAGPNTLTATSAGLSGSPVTFHANGTAGSAGKLAILTQPSSSAQSGASFAQQPRIQLQDQNGNPLLTNGVAISANSSAGTLNGNTTVGTVNGVATFANLSITGPVGTYTLTFSGNSLTGVTSNNIVLSAGAATQLVVTTQPSDPVRSGIPFPQQPVIQIQDAAGNPAPITKTIFATLRSGGGTLSGTTSISTGGGSSVTFTNLAISGLAGPRTLLFSASGLASDTSATFSVIAGNAAQIAAVSPLTQSAPVGTPVASPPSVVVKDGAGNPVAGVTVTFAVTQGGGSLNGPTQVSNASGVATVGDWTVGSLAGVNTVTATATGSGISGNPVSFTANGTSGAAVKLGVDRQPSSTAQSGVAIVVQPRIQIQDAAGNSVSQGGTTITASFSSGTGTLTNATATTNVAGLATFAGLAITGTVGSYTLQYDAPGLTGVTSNPITLDPGPANHVTITVQPPPTASSGVALSPQPVVQLRDGAGNAVSQGGTPITASIASGTGGSLTNTSATTDAGGEATFSGLALSGTTGNFTLSFGGTGLTPAVSNTIALGAGAASVLSIQTQPSSTAQNGVVFATQPSVRLRDEFGNPVQNPGVVVSVAILTGGGTLNGTTTATTNGGGIASFSNLSITGLVGSRTLIFSAGGFVSATSSAINITPGSATQLALTTEPSATVQSGVDFPTQPVVQLKDQSGNNVSQSSVPVNATIASGGGTLSGTHPINTNGNGQAVFTDLAISGLAGARTLTFSSSGLSSVTSGSIDVTAGQAAQLTITTQPSANAGSGVPFPQQPVIQLRDGVGNAVTQAGLDVDVAVLSGSATLSGTTTATTNGSGVASFTNLELTGPAGPHTLRFTSTGLTGVTSAVITLGAGVATKLSITTQPSATAQNSIPFPQQPAIQLRDAANNPVSQAGVAVTAAIATGGGTIGGTATVNTNASGLATFGNLEITGLVGNHTLTFTSGSLTPATSAIIDLNSGTATTIAASAGDGQSADVGTPVAVPPEVLVTDVSGNPVSGVNVTFAVAPGNGTVVPTTPVATDLNGNAAVTSWTLRNTPGTNTLTATSGSLTGSPVTFTATGLAGAPAKFTITTQPSSTAQNAIAFPQQPVLQLRDAQNNPVSQNGVQVTASIASGGGSLGGSTVTVNTDANGVATFPDLEITGTVGQRTLTFASSGLTGATSNVINLVAGDPTSIVAQAGNGQTATVGQPVATNPTVLVRDVSNNPVQDVAVTFAVETGGGSATGLNQTTDNNGLASVASWTLGTTAGSNTLSATSGTLTGSPVTFTATGAPDVADAAQSTANVPDGTIAVTTTITVQARDQFGNALTTGGSDVEVTVSGTNSATPTVTDNGDGTYTASYLPVLPGTDTITITLDGGQISGSPFTSNVGL